MKKIAWVLFGTAVLLSDLMCVHVAYVYRDIVCGMQHLGYSVPPSIAFLYAIPYLVGIAVFVTVGVLILKKAKRS
jgi:hypothetical protein